MGVITYKNVELISEGYLTVSKIHKLFYQEYGNPVGKAVLYLHGGPGSGFDPSVRQLFDPSFYRIVLFDQRGSGKSNPLGEIKDNNTSALINDIEKLRTYLEIDNWLIFGSSWGAALALLYSISCSEMVSGLILRGAGLRRKSEIDWFFKNGASKVFPDEWEKFANIDNVRTRSLLVDYYKILTNKKQTKDEKIKVVNAWDRWNFVTSNDPNSKFGPSEKELKHRIAKLKISCHYAINNSFLKTDNFILENINLIKNKPCHLIHGEVDCICPINNVIELKKKLPNAKLKIIKNSGHSMHSTAMLQEIIRSSDDFKTILVQN